MRVSIAFASLLFLSSLAGGCVSASPPGRIQVYLGPMAQDGNGPVHDRLKLPSDVLEVGLLVINDTTDPGSAPPLSELILSSLTNRVREQVELNFPIQVTKVLQPHGIAPDGNVQQFVRLAKEHALDYLLLAIFSSSESEIPTYLPLGGFPQGPGGRGSTPGYEARNFALVEMALLEGVAARPLVKACGQAYANLYQLNVPLQSNVYPVVRRSGRVPPIYPTEENAHDTLRGVAGDEALKQALMHLKAAWAQAFSA